MISECLLSQAYKLSCQNTAPAYLCSIKCTMHLYTQSKIQYQRVSCLTADIAVTWSSTAFQSGLSIGGLSRRIGNWCEISRRIGNWCRFVFQCCFHKSCLQAISCEQVLILSVAVNDLAKLFGTRHIQYTTERQEISCTLFLMLESLPETGCHYSGIYM